MTQYGQFCPIAKASELLGERWMLLIVRELLLGSTRFNQLQRALPLISPTLLTKRLNQLVDSQIVVKQTPPGQRSFEYFLTPDGKKLAPVIESLAIWGMRWIRTEIDEQDLDVEFLMWDIQRNIDTDHLPGKYHVIGFNFAEQQGYPNWWLVVDGSEVDLCTKNPGRDVDLHIVTSVRTLVDVWMGNQSITQALNSEQLKLIGNSEHRKAFKHWFTLSAVATV
ncbi:winged helix-turn-helix transcriptional regulator [Thalassotalea agarivorans]|uniref:Transcriptional regulator, HxlR family n=1 Tax=Thalassotalea agarivorans TaxID=349064 RepID=A0A1I0EK65_THASX|nr:helix-turn-helix domain-containing protein [Thalassotalea agarivorans]SET45577.1 transcriptional regulator, HxlR family [Thalassotalea agarivorans]